MFDPISRVPPSWEPAHEHGRRGQTLDHSDTYRVKIAKAVLGQSGWADCLPGKQQIPSRGFEL